MIPSIKTHKNMRRIKEFKTQLGRRQPETDMPGAVGGQKASNDQKQS